MRKFELSQKDESRAQSADSSKAYRKPRAFICLQQILRSFGQIQKVHLLCWPQKIIQVLGSLQRCSVDGRLLLVVKSYSCSEVCVRVNSMNWGFRVVLALRKSCLSSIE